MNEPDIIIDGEGHMMNFAQWTAGGGRGVTKGKPVPENHPARLAQTIGQAMMDNMPDSWAYDPKGDIGVTETHMGKYLHVPISFVEPPDLVGLKYLKSLPIDYNFRSTAVNIRYIVLHEGIYSFWDKKIYGWGVIDGWWWTKDSSAKTCPEWDVENNDGKE